jgi:hypothetical protein
MVPQDDDHKGVSARNSVSTSKSKNSSDYYSSTNKSDSAILESIDTPSLSVFNKIQNLTMEDVCLEDARFSSLPDVTFPSMNSLGGDHPKSFLLIDGKEHLKVSNMINIKI